MSDAMTGHIPVLRQEVVDYLSPRRGGFYIDATVGAGGHSKAIFEKEPSVKIIGIDCDPLAIEIAVKNLSAFGEGFIPILGNFADIEKIVAEHGKVNGVIADLGLSSMQIEDETRGFSFNSTEGLDMRMDGGSTGGITAGEVVNTFPEEELERIFKVYSDERFAGRIARAIVRRRRKSGHFESARSLGDFVAGCVGGGRWRNSRIHPATRIFQALRIFVNNEIENLSKFLDALPGVITPGGRCVVISFHSGEDRLVKQAFANFFKSGSGNLITKKPVVPTEEEVARNPRSRSAKLRAFEFGKR